MDQTTPETPVAPISRAPVNLREMVGEWRVAQVRAMPKGNEMRLALELAARGISYYLPLRRQRSARVGRPPYVYVPLFTSYVFFVGDDDARHAAMMTHRVAQMIDVPARSQQRLVNELEAVEKTLLLKPDVSLYPKIVAGKRCRVTQGHTLQGAEGWVEKIDEHRSRIILRVSILGKGVPLEIDPLFLEPCD